MARRNVLLITTDQQRFDALGCNGGKIARTPVLDRLAAEGVNYRQARAQNVVCMPARATILTGRHLRNHGVVANGVALPEDAPNVAAYLGDEGYRTALIGKAHFEPASHRDYFENWAASRDSHGPHRGFDHMELAGHTGRAGRSLFHYPKWLAEHHPQAVDGYYQTIVGVEVNGAGGGDTGAPQVWLNPIPRELYHTDWTAERTLAWLDRLDDDADWLVWMSFPDPHHPWDPPAAELKRVPWREIDPPAGYPGSPERCREILAGKPSHWLEWYEGRRRFAFEVPPRFRPCDLTPDQIREVDAATHVENELIDEAIGRVLARIAERGWAERTDVLYTTDHGEFQGDSGMLFKGPYHVDALMRLPMIWRPAPVAGVTPAAIESPVGHLDLAPTICRIAGLPVPEWMDGTPLPATEPEAGRDWNLTEWLDAHEGVEVRIRTISHGSRVMSVYEQTNWFSGEEGELYDLREDPLQWRNLWDDPAHAATRRELADLLHERTPAGRPDLLPKVAPV